MPETTNPRIERALSIVEREVTRTTDERSAFTRFITRLSQLELPDQRTDGGVRLQQQRLLKSDSSSDRLIQQIKTAYRETVMSTPHYEEDYNESFERNVAAEFGPEVAHLLVRSERLTPIQYQTIRRSAEQSREERTDFLAILERERVSLEEIDTRLSEIESQAFEIGDTSIGSRSFESLIEDRKRLVELEDSCRSLSTRRQEEIHNRSQSRIAGIGESSLIAYLYAECAETCPGLIDIIDVLDSVQQRRRRFERELSGRR